MDQRNAPAHRAPQQRVGDLDPARLLLAIFLAALAVRLVNGLSIALVEGWTFMIQDSPLYYAIVDDWRETGRMMRIGPEGVLFWEFERPPLYPLLLWGMESLWGRSDLAVALVQGLLDAGTCVMIADMARRLGPRIGLIAGGLAALSPVMATTSAVVLNDTLFLFLQTAGAWALLRFGEGGGVRMAGLAGLAFGLACATRVQIQYLLPLLVLLLVILAVRLDGPRLRRAGAVLLFVIALAAPLAPILKASHDAYGEAFISRQAGVHILGWVLPTVHPDTASAPQSEGSRIWQERFGAEMARRGIDLDAVSPPVLQRLRQEYGVAQLTDVPLGALLTGWTKGALLNVALPAVLYDERVRALSPTGFSAVEGDGLAERAQAYIRRADPAWVAIALTAAVGAGAMTLLHLLGLGLLAGRRPWIALLLVLGAGYHLGVLGPVAAAKYRLPVEPILLVLSAVALDWLLRRWAFRGRASRGRTSRGRA